MPVFIKPLVTNEMSVYRDGYGNKREWRNYNKSLNVTKAQLIPQPGLKSITYRALVKSEHKRDPNNSIGIPKHKVHKKTGKVTLGYKKPKRERFINYLVTVQFHKLDFNEKESKQFNQPWLVEGKTHFSRTPTIAANPAMMRCQCFTGDTLVRMADGSNTPIKSLIGKERFDVVSYDENKSKPVVAKGVNAKSYGKKEVYELELDNGHKIKCTADHKFLLKNGSWVEAKDLKPTYSLNALYFNEKNNVIVNSETEFVLSESEERKNFYTYVYLDPRKQGEFSYGDFTFSFEPFYVGKGTTNRDVIHGYKSKRGTKTFFHNKLRKLNSLGLEPLIIRVKDSITEDAAFKLEHELIKTIGRHDLGLGPLTNMGNGGDGLSGYRYSSDLRKRMSDIKKEQIASGKFDIKKNIVKAQAVIKEKIANGTFYLQSDVRRKKQGLINNRMISEGRALGKSPNFIKRKNLENWITSLSFGESLVTDKEAKQLGYSNKYKLKQGIDRLANQGIIFKDYKIIKEHTFNHKIKSVKPLGVEEVFCITVPDYGNFYVDAGNDSAVNVANCRDFSFTWEKSLAESGGLWPNNKWTKYVRLTPPTVTPPRNPKEKMGYCKHVATLLQFMYESGLVKNK